MAFPYSVQWMVTEDSSDFPLLEQDLPPSRHLFPFMFLFGSCKVVIVAPKRKFKHAVDRNRVRRLTRECYRQRKGDFYSFLRQQRVNIVLSLVYVHNEIMPYDQLGHKMDKLFVALEKDIVEKTSKQ
jgi:RNase P protein component